MLPRDEARAYKAEIEAYIARNPRRTRAFPQHDPQVWELYWSAPQVRARVHPNLLAVQRSLLRKLWHVNRGDSGAEAMTVFLDQPLAYADRLRIRQPGDASFALGPHMDNGSVERWEREGYGVGRVYDAIFEGRWDMPVELAGYDAHEASGRAVARMDRYNGLGSCSMFRAYQGWLSISRTGPGEGTLKVYPNLKAATAYVLLRPFFRPLRPRGDKPDVEEEAFLDESNWVFTAPGDMTSDLQGATLGHCQEISDEWHPHLDLGRTMLNVPAVEPGDYVVWHCDGKFRCSPLICRYSHSDLISLSQPSMPWIPSTPAPPTPPCYTSRSAR